MMPLGVVRDDQILDTRQRSRQHNGLIDRCRLDAGCEIKISVIRQGSRPKQLKKKKKWGSHLPKWRRWERSKFWSEKKELSFRHIKKEMGIRNRIEDIQ